MQRILSFCIGWLAGKQKFARSLLTGERPSAADSTERAQEGLPTPPLPPTLPQKGDLANPLPLLQEGEPYKAPSATEEENSSSPLLPGEMESPAAPFPCKKGPSQSSVAGALLPSDSKSSVSSPCTGRSDNLAQSLMMAGSFGDNNKASSEELRPDAAQVPAEEAVPNRFLLCRCGHVPPHRLFGEQVPQAATTKSKSGSFTSKASGKSESSSVMSCEEAPGEINESYWQRYQAMLPLQPSLESIHGSKKMQLATPTGPFEKGGVASGTIGELLREGVQVGVDGRQNTRISTDASVSNVPSIYIYPFPVNGEGSRSGSTINRPPCSSSSSVTAARQTPRSESDKCFKPKLETPESYKSVDRGSVVKPSESKSWCKCSQEILLHRLEGNASYKGRRGTF